MRYNIVCAIQCNNCIIILSIVEFLIFTAYIFERRKKKKRGRRRGGKADAKSIVREIRVPATGRKEIKIGLMDFGSVFAQEWWRWW